LWGASHKKKGKKTSFCRGRARPGVKAVEAKKKKSEKKFQVEGQGSEMQTMEKKNACHIAAKGCSIL